MRIKQFIFLAIGCATAVAVFADDNSKTVLLSETPAAVQKTINAQLGDGKLGSIDKTVDGEDTTYDIELTTKGGQERDFTVDEDGTLLSVGVTLSETPAAVQKVINLRVGTGKLENIDKAFDDGEVSYDVEMTTKDGQERDFTVDEDGTLLSMGVTLSETPAAVQKAIQMQMREGKLKSIDKMFDDDGITYDVEITTMDGREKEFNVAANGKLASMKVTLGEVPPAVRKTIRGKIGGGKILRIDKSFVENKGVLPYEVQGRKDGKPFDFSVGPKGRFLGMED
jgi:uncharacterized membrane protein YkoI